jgi:hypothetical protein
MGSIGLFISQMLFRLQIFVFTMVGKVIPSRQKLFSLVLVDSWNWKFGI